jgi:hypothetical protein
MIIKNKVYKMDLIIIGITIVALLLLIGYARPMVIAPKNNFVSSDNLVLFSFEKANFLLIDDNPEFTSPEKIEVRDNLIVNLKPGAYYWKTVGVLQSEVRKLTINSNVDLKFKENENEGKYEVVNAGNTKLLVDIYNNTNLVGNVILAVDESADVSGTKFLGRQNEE